MANTDLKDAVQTDLLRTVIRIGCVSFLNAKPLIDGLTPDLASADQHQVTFDVPSRLLAHLEAGRVDVALCPVIDYYRSSMPLCVVPAGGISSEGPTLTVRLFSRVPPEQIQSVRADPDSHTSVALLRILLAQQYGIHPPIVACEPDHLRHTMISDGEALMLIGDKVITSAPPAVQFPFQIDLGQAWHDLTGLPFLFAVWMCRQSDELANLPARLNAVRQCNAHRVDNLVATHATAHGWPTELARKYLGQLLQYEVSQRHLTAMARFADLAAGLDLINRTKPLHVLSWRSAKGG